MLQTVSMTTSESQAKQAAISSIATLEGIIPSIDESGRISLPGFASGLSIETYLPLVHLYTRILEASRILDRYRDRLRLKVADSGLGHFDEECSGTQGDQAPLTALEPSRLIPHLYYKREDQTVTRAYKVRGALVAMAKAMQNRLPNGQQTDRFIAVSTGNHAMGILMAAELLQPASVRIVAPTNTAPWKLDKIHAAVARLRNHGVHTELLLRGETFDEARAWALNEVESTPGEAYLDPYSNPWVVAGQGTLGLELLSQVLPLLEKHPYQEVLIISPVGGGGLLTGTSTAFKMASASEPLFRTVNTHFLGLRLQNLDSTLGDAIRVAEVAPANLALIDALQIPLRTMSEQQMADGVRLVQSDLGERVEGASGGTVSPVLADVFYGPSDKRLVISILSGANTQ